MNLKDLQTEYRNTLKEAEDIRLKYNGKAKDMPGDELERWQKAMDDCDKLADQISALEKHEKHEAFNKTANDVLEVAGKEKTGDPQKDLARKAFVARLKGSEGGPQDQAAIKAYQNDDMAGGGFFVMPTELATEILTLLKDRVYVRSKARTFSLLSADTLGVPAIDSDPSDTDWTTELATGTEEGTLKAGKRELKCNPMAKRFKISRTLIRKAPAFEETVLDRLAYKVAVTEEKAFLTGDGSQKPLGVFTAAAGGISTNRDVAAAGSNAITADDVINCLFNLKAQYRNRASWILHRTVLQAIRKLKDSNNNYIWATGLGPGTGYQGLASTLLGLEYNESEYAPNTIATGQYTLLVGCFDFYYIVDALDMQMQVLDQLYAENNQMGYILRRETDGMPALEEAFSRLKQA